MLMRSAATIESMSPGWVDSSRTPMMVFWRWIGTATVMTMRPVRVDADEVGDAAVEGGLDLRIALALVGPVFLVDGEGVARHPAHQRVPPFDKRRLGPWPATSDARITSPET